MFPKLEEGGLATYRASLVQNQHLAILAGVGVSLIIVKFLSIYLSKPNLQTGPILNLVWTNLKFQVGPVQL